MALKDVADALLREAVEQGDVPGVVALATDSRATYYEAGRGCRKVGGGAAMTPDSVLYIASMTKAITAVAALQLVERGLLALDRPAKDYVPYLGEVPVLTGFDAAGQPRLRPPVRPITLRHLLTHTAGFGYRTWQQPIGDYADRLGLPAIASCRDLALTTPLLFDPGTRWQYGIGIDWAGKMIEAASGRRLGAWLEEYVLGPLGMTDTAFRITPDMRRRLATVHARGADGSLAPLPDYEIEQNPEFEMGGGGLYGTAGDYAKFIRMILNGGRAADGSEILAPASVAALTTGQTGGHRVGPLTSVLPAISRDAEFFPGVAKAWSLGFMINIDAAPTGRSAGALGWAGLANTFYWIDPTRGVGGVFAAQTLPFADERVLDRYLAFEAAVYANLGAVPGGV